MFGAPLQQVPLAFSYKTERAQGLPDQQCATFHMNYISLGLTLSHVFSWTFVLIGLCTPGEYSSARSQPPIDYKTGCMARRCLVFYIFTFRWTSISPRKAYLWFRQFVKKNGLRYIRFHDLRYTSATILINQGVHAKIISERLGHGSITTSINIHGHALRTADQALLIISKPSLNLKLQDA